MVFNEQRYIPELHVVVQWLLANLSKCFQRKTHIKCAIKNEESFPSEKPPEFTFLEYNRLVMRPN